MESIRQLASFSLLVVVVLGSLRLAEPVEMNPLDLNLPDECEAVVLGEELDSDGANQNSIPRLELPPDHLPWLNFSRGEFLLDSESFGSFSRSVEFSAGTMTLSRTAYGYVYLVTGTLTFRANNTMEMRIQITGALSVKSRELCARGCTTQGPSPAWFLYFGSGSNPDFLPKSKAIVVPDRDCGILARFRYPRAKTSKTLLISGEMKSLRNADDDLQFPPIDIAAVFEGDGFRYTRMEEVRKLADSFGSRADYLRSTDISEHSTVCESFEDGDRLPVVWSSDCGLVESGDCSPFKKYSKIYDVRNSITSVKLTDFDCSMDGKLSGFLGFGTNEIGVADPGMSTHLLLVLEGIWDFKNENFLMLACLLDASDCKIRVSLEVSDIFRTITHPLAIFGRVQSLRDRDDPLYFQPFSFVGGGWLSVLSEDSRSRLQIMNQFGRAPTLMELIEPICSEKQFPVIKGAKYPGGADFSDMDLKIQVVNPNASRSTAATLPIFLTAMELGNSRREWSFTKATRGFPVDENQSGLQLNVSFVIHVPGMQDLFYKSKEQWFKRIVAEGLYDRSTGRLCMLGCRSKIWAADGYDDDDTNGQDCSVLFSIRYGEVNPSLWGDGTDASGSILSLRSASDPLGFKPVNLDSYGGVSKYQARQTLWRKRVDIIISMSTLLLLVIVLLPELYTSKDQSKHQIFPYGSLVVLTALVAGHSVSLYFSINSMMLKFPGSPSEDPSVNVSRPSPVEFFTTVASMTALLLEMRWLYLTIKACGYDEVSLVSMKMDLSARVAEHHICYICLPILGLVFTVVQLTFLSGQQLLASEYEESMYRRYRLQQMMWVNLQISADVISYFFLLPRVLTRVLWENKTRSLKPIYIYYLYMVLSLIRSLAEILFSRSDMWPPIR